MLWGWSGQRLKLSGSLARPVRTTLPGLHPTSVLRPFGQLTVRLRYEAPTGHRLPAPVPRQPPSRKQMSARDSNRSLPASRDFVRQIIDQDLADGKYGERVVTRFPPEPNGYLHIGHAKSILLNFGISEEYGGQCHLRFDDTNPTTEEPEYVRAIQEDVRWLGFDWGEHLYHAADYFGQMYDYAEALIEKGKAYVDSRPEGAVRESRGTVTRPGTPSPDRDRSVEENLELFRRMRAGDFADGEHVVRAKIDLGSPNMLMRDPILYRIRHARHHRTGDEWCIYPLYDFAHCLGDAIEGVTHSLCTPEFANNRELYDWILDEVGIEEPRPHQYEFGKGLVDYTITSKRKLLQLVGEGHVDGWDDPRMPTLAAFRRRGVPPEAVLAFWKMVGVARANARIDIGRLEYAIRDELNQTAPRVFAVLDPLRVVLTDWPIGRVEELNAPYFPHDVPVEGSRRLDFSGELYIEREDFSEAPPAGFRRLVPGGEVRLRYGCIIRCEQVIRDSEGRVVELRCSHDPESWHGTAGKGRKVRGTIHWVSALHAVPCEIRLYDRLFSVSDPEAAAEAQREAGDFTDFLNPESLQVREGALVEPSVLEDPRETRYQFERVGYFWRDPIDDLPDRPVFNRIVALRDSWARMTSRSEASEAEEEASARPTPAVPGRRPTLTPEVRSRAEEIRARFGLSEVDAEILGKDPVRVDFLEAAVRAYPAPDEVSDAAVPLAHWIINDLPRVQGSRALDELPFGPEQLASLVELVAEGVISSRAGGEVLEVLAQEGGEPREIVDRLDLSQMSDAEVLGPLIAEVLEAHPEKVREFRGGKHGLLGFFMGQVMGRTGGKADPEVTGELLRQRLAED